MVAVVADAVADCNEDEVECGGSATAGGDGDGDGEVTGDVAVTDATMSADVRSWILRGVRARRLRSRDGCVWPLRDGGGGGSNDQASGSSSRSSSASAVVAGAVEGEVEVEAVVTDDDANGDGV